MCATRPDYLTYLLRLRRAEDLEQSGSWISLEDLTAGACHDFAGLDALFAFLEAQASRLSKTANVPKGAAPATPLRGSISRGHDHLVPLLEDDKQNALFSLSHDLSQKLNVPQEHIYQALISVTTLSEPMEVPDRSNTPSASFAPTRHQEPETTVHWHNRELSLLNRALQLLTISLELDHVLGTLLEGAHLLVEATASALWLVDPETESLVCQKVQGFVGDTACGYRLTIGAGSAGLAAYSGESRIIANAVPEDNHLIRESLKSGARLCAILSTPLEVKGEIIGVLEMLDTTPNHFTQTDQAFLEFLAASAAVAIDNARLVTALRQRTAELEAHNAELDAFAHTVAHDLKNPINLIMGYAMTLSEGYIDLKEDLAQEVLQRIVHNSSKMNNIIDALLLLAGVRKMDITVEPLRMREIIAGVQQRLSRMVEEYQAQIRISRSLPVALGYGPWIEEVWVNYLSNAIKYGGHPPVITVGAEVQSDGWARFWIHDNGQGLTPEQQKRLFIPFTRLEKGVGEGHGLGLSIVRRIIEKLGGEVGVESEVGKGSTFFFTLPLAPTLE